MPASPITVAEDTEAANWIVASLQTFAKSVTSVVPDGFPAYVRVFHPAYRGQQPVSWTEIAAANGTHPHPGMQLCALTGIFHAEQNQEGQPGVYDSPPTMGSLPPELRSPLLSVLSRHTTTPERCWFAIWNGYGARHLAEINTAPTFKLPGREYHLVFGAIEVMHAEFLNPPWRQSANIWWPDDRAWCVATEIDFSTTYIGCSETCRDDLVGREELEAMAVDPATGIDWKSDALNPEPSRPDSEA